MARIEELTYGARQSSIDTRTLGQVSYLLLGHTRSFLQLHLTNRYKFLV